MCQTIADYFFADAKGSLPAEPSMRDIDLIYNDYVRVMNACYEKQRHTYNNFVNKFLTPAQKQEFHLYPEDIQTHPVEESKSEDTDDSTSELKKHLPPTAIERGTQEKSFSQRIKAGEIKCDLKSVQSVANAMLFEMNALAARCLILQHKVVEVIKIAPRFVSEYL